MLEALKRFKLEFVLSHKTLLLELPEHRTQKIYHKTNILFPPLRPPLLGTPYGRRILGEVTIFLIFSFGLAAELLL